MNLLDRYDEIVRNRIEGRRKYRGSRWYHIYGPSVRLRFPQVSKGRPDRPHVSIGPISVAEIHAVESDVRQFISMSRKSLRILEIGPGRGDLASVLRADFGSKITDYVGLERDESVTGSYDRVSAPNDLHGTFDLVIASEVAEHMPFQTFFEILERTRPHLNDAATLVMSVPNPLTPGGIARDFTHVQSWPWYDLYAVLRLVFHRVEIYRAYHICGLSRLLLLPARFAISRALELDWCEGLIAVAQDPLPLDIG